MARPLFALLLLLMPILASAQTFRFGLRRDIPTSVDPAGVASPTSTATAPPTSPSRSGASIP
jgi:hypothetical protein